MIPESAQTPRSDSLNKYLGKTSGRSKAQERWEDPEAAGASEAPGREINIGEKKWDFKAFPAFHGSIPRGARRAERGFQGKHGAGKAPKFPKNHGKNRTPTRLGGGRDGAERGFIHVGVGISPGIPSWILGSPLELPCVDLGVTWNSSMWIL